MKNMNKLYLSIGLLISLESSMMAKITPENCDQELHKVIEQDLFGKESTKSFSEIVDSIIEILEVKMTTMSADEQKKCQEIINLLQNNKDKKVFGAWAGILQNILKFEKLLSDNTRDFIKTMNPINLITILRAKLQS